MRESNKKEFKEIYSNSIKKEIVAFANSEGGQIYIGIDDEGRVIGIENADEAMLRITNIIRDSIKPDITMFVNCTLEKVDEKDIVLISIEQGSNKPYYLAEKGMKPSGVYVRQGTSSAPASEEAIRQMIKETDGDVFEKMRSINQELSFSETRRAFESNHMEFSEVQYQTLGIVDGAHEYTNLGLLLSDQCPYTIKCAVFEGDDSNDFQDRREFGGPLLKQLRDVFEYIELHNKLKSNFVGLYRIDQREFPEEAVREALLNCIVHRDYSFSDSTQIRLYQDKIEFVSIGGLLKGIELEDVLMGMSICRNKKLAEVFFRLNLIESYGTGLDKIQKSYKNNNSEPEILSTKNIFKIVLPKLLRENSSKNSMGSVISDEEEKILKYAGTHNDFSRTDIDKLLRTSQPTSSRLLKKMIEKGLLESHGNSKNTRYNLKK